MQKVTGAILILILMIICFGTLAYSAKAVDTPVVLATLYFKMDSAEIDPKFKKDLKKIQAALGAAPDMGLRIVSYAHQPGDLRKNREVIQKRIQAVQQWFSMQGIAKNRLKAKTFIDRKPPVQKLKAEDAAPQERVEILQISLKQPLAVVPAPAHQFEPVAEGQEVAHAFIVQNKGSAPLEINRVKTD